MQDNTTHPRSTLAEGRAAWLRQMADMGDDRGYFEPLGTHHHALFCDDGPNLLVTFESLETIAVRRPDDYPVCYRVTESRGWSHLCIIADGPTWYRDPRVWGFFDRLIDDGFFEDFDRVTFYGAGMGGYAACAFSVAAPGASVLAIRPVATVDPRIAGWDDRFATARRLDFHSRYGYAPDMIDGADRVFVVFDPEVDEDAVHAALFRKRFVTPLECPHLGPAPELALAEMGLLAPLIDAAGSGTLTPAAWAQMWRARRDHAPWLRRMALHLAEGPSRLREAVFLRAALARFPGLPRLRKRYDELCAGLTAAGIALPVALPDRA